MLVMGRPLVCVCVYVFITEGTSPASHVGVAMRLHHFFASSTLGAESGSSRRYGFDSPSENPLIPSMRVRVLLLPALKREIGPWRRGFYWLFCGMLGDCIVSTSL